MIMKERKSIFQQNLILQNNIEYYENYYFISSAKTTGGFSGGPYVRTLDNCVVGICHGYWSDAPDSSVGVRITQNMIDIIIENSQ